MRAASFQRRFVRFVVIAAALTLALAATAFDVPGARTEATSEAPAAFAFAGAEVGRAEAAARAPLICIDPGHSFANPGMVVTAWTADADGRSRERELREVAINLDVAREVVRRLRVRFGTEAVVMTWGEVDGRPRWWNALRGPVGDDKLDVMLRGAFCTQHDALAVASIHTNWFGDAPNGTLTGYRDENDRAFADAVHSAIRDAVRRDPAGRPLGGFVDYGLDQGEWFLMLAIGRRDVPAVILEPVMMSNPDEARRLLPSIAEAPAGRRAQIARIEALALGDWIAATLLAGW